MAGFRKYVAATNLPYFSTQVVAAVAAQATGSEHGQARRPATEPGQE